jgi:hypothetical protein
MPRLLTRKNASNATSTSALALEVANVARYEAAKNGSCAHKSADNSTAVYSNGSVSVVLAEVTVTPQSSGAFVVSGTVLCSNAAPDNTYPAELSIGHNGAVDYTQANGAPIGPDGTIPMSIVADNHLTGQVFTVGVPVTLQLFLVSSFGAAANIYANPHQAQIFVQELPNV